MSRRTQTLLSISIGLDLEGFKRTIKQIFEAGGTPKSKYKLKPAQARPITKGKRDSTIADKIKRRKKRSKKRKSKLKRGY